MKFKDWTFIVEKTRTKLRYKEVIQSGADSCKCEYCLNYAMNRENVFPNEIIELFDQLGIDYRKEVEVTEWETFENGRIHIGGWFHFIGEILEGEKYKVPLPNGGTTYKLTKITDNFSIGFDYGNDLTFFDNNEELVQVEFDTVIPWVLKKGKH